MSFFEKYGEPKTIRRSRVSTRKKKPKIQTIYETYMYCAARPTREELATEIKWQRLKFLRQNLARAANRGEYTKEISITLEELYEIGEKQDWKCAITGVPLEFTRGGTFANGTNPNSCTLDRDVNWMGYTKENVQLTTWRVNGIKNHLSTKEFVELCKLVANHVDKKKK